MKRGWLVPILAGALLASDGRSDAASDPGAAFPESGPRLLAVGGAGAAAADGADAAWWNPAGLADAPRSELVFSHIALAPGLVQQSGVFALRPLGERALVVALQADLLREEGIPIAEVGPGLAPVPPQAGYRAALHLAGGLGRGFALGMSVGRWRGLPGDADPGPGYVADTGLRWSHGGSRAALAARGIRVSGGPQRDPVLAAAGAQSFASERILWSVEVDRGPEGAVRPASGLEWRPRELLALRAGARYDSDARETSAACGFGLRHDRIRLDYALTAGRGERTVHALALGFDLGSEAAAATAGSRARPARRPSRRPSPEDTAPPVPAPAPRRADEPPVSAPQAAPRDNTSMTIPSPPPPAPRVSAAPTPPAPRANAAPQTPPTTAPRADASPPLPSSTPPAARVDASPPLPGAAPAAPGAQPAPGSTQRFAVRAGPFPDLESAAAVIMRLRQADLRAGVEGSGKQFFVVLRRGATRSEAEALQAKAARAKVRCSLAAE